METLLGILSGISITLVGGGIAYYIFRSIYRWMRSFDSVDAMKMANEDPDWDDQLDRLDDTKYQTWLSSVQAGRDAEKNALDEGKSKEEARNIRDQARANYMKEMVV
jgi:hypothetical protein